jgi:hypothetical protein
LLGFRDKKRKDYLAITQGECNLEFAPIGRCIFGLKGVLSAPQHDPKEGFGA